MYAVCSELKPYKQVKRGKPPPLPQIVRSKSLPLKWKLNINILLSQICWNVVLSDTVSKAYAVSFV